MTRLGWRTRHALVGAVLGLTAAAVSVPVKAETWRAYTYSPRAGIAAGDSLHQIAADVRKATDGKLEIAVFMAGALPISAAEISQAVGQGVLQLGLDSFQTSNVPALGVLRLPLLVTSEEEYRKASAIVLPKARERYAALGVTLLGEYHYTPVTLFGGARSIATLKDVAGKKIRVNTPELESFVRSFGGIPLSLTSQEVAPALQRGTVDGVTSTASGGGSLWRDFLRSNYRIDLYVPSSYFIVNTAAFERLSPAVQAAVRQAVAAAGERATAFNVGTETDAVASMRAKGMGVHEPSAAERAEATGRMKPLWEDWARSKGPEFEQTLREVRAALGK